MTFFIKILALDVLERNILIWCWRNFEESTQTTSFQIIYIGADSFLYIWKVALCDAQAKF